MTSSIADRKGFLLILFSSILLGIWATVNTIALRNILLVFNAGLSIIYIREWLKVRDASHIRNHLRSTDFFNWLPSVLIVAMFIWVIAHYLLFSQYPQKQWDELSSTWLRAFMASVIGFGCALALRRNQSLAWMLWLGLIVSFLVLTYQYIPKAITNKSMFATDSFGYIYWAKYSGVLAGTLLFAGTLGLSIDSARQLLTATKISEGAGGQFNAIALVLTITFGLFLPIYAFVFIFSAKNGVGVAAILLIFWFAVCGAHFAKLFFGKERHQHPTRSMVFRVVALLLAAFAFFWFAYQHAKYNPGWGSVIEDIRISTQIDKYQNWKNPSKYDYPKREDGSSVAANTYERTALAVVGLNLISRDPIGNGVLMSLPSQMQQGGYEYDYYLNYTHSAWIDLGLSYGWPAILMLPAVLVLCLIACIKKYRGPYRATATSLAVSFLVLYLVGEYAFQHGIEILLFACALLAGLVFPTPKPIPALYPVQ